MSDQLALFPESDAVSLPQRDWPVEIPASSVPVDKDVFAPADQPSLFDTGDAA